MCFPLSVIFTIVIPSGKSQGNKATFSNCSDFNFSSFFMFDVRRKEAFLDQFSGELCAKISDEVLTESIRVTAEAEIR